MRCSNFSGNMAKSRCVLQNSSAGTTTRLMRKSVRWDLQFSCGEVREIAAFLGIEESRSQRYFPNQADAYARGNRGNDWHHARDGESLVLRLQEETIAPTEGLHFDCSQQTCARENGSSVTTVLEAASSGREIRRPKDKIPEENGGKECFGPAGYTAEEHRMRLSVPRGLYGQPVMVRLDGRWGDY